MVDNYLESRGVPRNKAWVFYLRATHQLVGVLEQHLKAASCVSLPHNKHEQDRGFRLMVI